MPPERLLRLYPPAWRERYAEEFLTTVGQQPLRPGLVFDIVCGAIDAWLSADVRRATNEVGLAATGRRPTMLNALLACERKQARATVKDGLIGAGVMIGTTALFVALGTALRTAGWVEGAKAVVALSAPMSYTLSMPFWAMKGQPWKAQAVIVGGTMAILVVIGYLSTI
jgi:hypothetical protein